MTKMRCYVEITTKDSKRTHQVPTEPSDTNGDNAVRGWCRTGNGPRAVWDRLEALKETDPDAYERHFDDFAHFFCKQTSGSIKVVNDKRPQDGNSLALWNNRWRPDR